MVNQILEGDCLDLMKKMPDKHVQCCITSPPYYSVRDYGIEGQIGAEETPEEYIEKMVEIFREVRRILKDNGTVWLNIGDTYKNKKLLMIPHKLAIALQKDGWLVRQDIIWNKTACMPEPVKDRCVQSHEHIFLLSKKTKYYFDWEAIQEPVANPNRKNYQNGSRSNGINGDRNDNDLFKRSKNFSFDLRRKRSVWSVATKAYPEAHFAVFPPELIEPCVLAGCPFGGTVIDPFGGSGTTAVVAMMNGRKSIICELNEKYISIAQKRILEVKKEYGIDSEAEWL